MKNVLRLFLLLAFICCSHAAYAGANDSTKTHAAKPKAKFNLHAVKDADIATAVRACATKDCGCGECAGKGCAPCKGKNCYYCVAKALTAKECGCGMCDPKGCDMCGPGCDVCKFHLKPLEDSKSPSK